MYDIQISEEQRELLLALIRTELLDSNTQNQSEIDELEKLEELLD